MRDPNFDIWETDDDEPDSSDAIIIHVIAGAIIVFVVLAVTLGLACIASKVLSNVAFETVNADRYDEHGEPRR